jgi:hypothetical protein
MPQITQIQVRRDTAATWTSTNPTLAAGEIGFETDTGKFKIGTGSTAWTSLLYATDASDITGTTLPASITSASGLATVGTITSGTWNATEIAIGKGGTGATTAALARTALGVAASGANSDITSLSGITTPLSAAQGGTGFGYGTALVGRAVLTADRTKPNNNNTPEAFTWDNAGTPAIQYLNLEGSTIYSFDGYAQMVKDTSTSALPRASVLHYSTGTTTTTPTAVSCQIVTQSNTALFGLIDITAANTPTTSNGTSTSVSTHHFRISGYILTNANGGRFTIGIAPSSAPTAAPTFKAGSYLNVYKHGTTTASPNFGNWSS